MDLFRSRSLGQFQSPFVKMPAVQFISVRIPNTTQISSSGMIQQKQPRFCQVTCKLEWPGPARMPGEVLCHASLNKVTSSKDERPTKCCKASYASPVIAESYLCSLQTSHALPWVSPQQSAMWVCFSKTPRESVTADITLPISWSPRKQQEATRAPPEGFFSWCVSLTMESQKSAQLRIVRWTNTSCC